MRYLKLLPLLIVFALATAVAADPLAGVWDVRGWEPGHRATAEPDYVGQARLVQRGEGYYFSGQMDGESYEGVGLFDPASGVFSVMFEAEGGKARGATALKLQPDGVMRGQWVYFHDRQGKLGAEVWTRAQPQ